MALNESLHVLAHSYRRRILIALTDHNPQTADELNVTRDNEAVSEMFESFRRDQKLESELKHIHLPKLADYSYITYDSVTGRIERGPNFDEIVPLLELIRDYADESGHRLNQ